MTVGSGSEDIPDKDHNRNNCSDCQEVDDRMLEVGYARHLPAPLPRGERGSLDRLRTRGGGELRTRRGSPSPPHQVRGRLRPLCHEGRGGPSTGSGRAGAVGSGCAGAHPHPSPLPSRERGAVSNMDEWEGGDVGPWRGRRVVQSPRNG